MPVYEYLCDTHGAFDALRPMSAYAEPCPCPSCSLPAARVLFTPPRLAARDRAGIACHAVNERAANEPKRASRHAPGCACCAPPARARSRDAAAKPAMAKGFPARRPWMISH